MRTGRDYWQCTTQVSEMQGHRRIQVVFRLPYSLKRDGEWFIASADDLDVVTQGETREVAVENLKDALRLFLEYCIEAGTLQQVLRESGFEKVDDSAEPEQGDYVEVPVNLLSTSDVPNHAY